MVVLGFGLALGLKLFPRGFKFTLTSLCSSLCLGQIRPYVRSLHLSFTSLCASYEPPLPPQPKREKKERGYFRSFSPSSVTQILHFTSSVRIRHMTLHQGYELTLDTSFLISKHAKRSPKKNDMTLGHFDTYTLLVKSD